MQYHDSRSVPENEKEIREKNELMKWPGKVNLLATALVVIAAVLVTLHVLSVSRVDDDDHPRTQFHALDELGRVDDMWPSGSNGLRDWMPTSGGDGNEGTSAPADCPHAWKLISPSSSEAIHLAQCGVDGLPKAQHIKYKFGRVFMVARQTLGTDVTNMRISAILFRQKMVLPEPGPVVPVAVLMEVTEMKPHCGLKKLIGMYAGLPLNETSLTAVGHYTYPHLHYPHPHRHSRHYQYPHYPDHPHDFHFHLANPSGWRDVPSPQHILLEAQSAAKFAAKKMTSTCAFEAVSHPQYQVMRDGFRFHMTVMVKNPSTGKTVPCAAEVHATVHAHYHLVKGHCFAGEGC